MSAERVLALATLAVSALALVWLGPRAVVAWRIYAGTGRRRQEDAGGRAPAAPGEVADRIAVLGELGYERLGETRLLLPVGERFAWIVAARDARSYAIIVSGIAGLTGFYSAWSDGTWLGTLHPRGQATDRRGFQVRIVGTSLADAVALHRSGIDRLISSHGAPRPVRTMADMLALDADYRSRFGGSRLRTPMLRIVLPAIAAAIVVVLALALLVTTPT